MSVLARFLLAATLPSCVAHCLPKIQTTTTNEGAHLHEHSHTRGLVVVVVVGVGVVRLSPSLPNDAVLFVCVHGVFLLFLNRQRIPSLTRSNGDWTLLI